MHKLIKVVFISFFIFCFQSKSLMPEPQFFVIIPTYNNASRCISNLESVLMQNNENYIIYIVDDASTDDTPNILQHYIDQYRLHHKVILIRNKQRLGALANIYNTIHTYCSDKAIIIFLDGDDRLHHARVLDRVLQEYLAGAWMTYGQFIGKPRGEKGFCQPFPKEVIEKRNFRSFKWVSSHLRTCKGWLFKQIKLQDLLQDDGAFYHVAWDRAIMLPLLEMAAPHHIRFIPDVLYEYLHHTNNDYVHSYQAGLALAKHIHQRPKYPRVQQPIYLSKNEQKADLIIFSYDRPLQLYAYLESIKKYIIGLESIVVICKASDAHYRKAYEEVNQAFPYVMFKYQNNDLKRADFKPLVIQLVEQARTPYILFGVDDIVVKDFISISECIRALEQTQAYGFYLRMGENINYCYPEKKNQPCPIRAILTHPFRAWQFKDGIGDWGYPNTVDMTLYRKSEVLMIAQRLTYHSPNTFEGSWSGQRPSSPLGVCYVVSKMVNIPLNLVQNDWINPHMHGPSPKELLDKWNQKLKFDIRPLHQINNRDPHEEHYLPLIPRM